MMKEAECSTKEVCPEEESAVFPSFYCSALTMRRPIVPGVAKLGRQLTSSKNKDPDETVFQLKAKSLF